MWNFLKKCLTFIGGIVVVGVLAFLAWTVSSPVNGNAAMEAAKQAEKRAEQVAKAAIAQTPAAPAEELAPATPPASIDLPTSAGDRKKSEYHFAHKAYANGEVVIKLTLFPDEKDRQFRRSEKGYFVEVFEKANKAIADKFHEKFNVVAQREVSSSGRLKDHMGKALNDIIVYVAVPKDRRPSQTHSPRPLQPNRPPRQQPAGSKI
ncbi:MAG: hypothetical protein FJZ04_04325 [Candidatus Moranbacteria bacterium]|nr:hypothetical protein [Candidatus Moranbacteria bacterium]